MSGFLEEVALVADIDDLESGSDYVVLMTLHSAKGLEFPNVYMAGMEDGLFPSYMTITSDDPMEIEEERRLCYVGITRARERLTMTGARMRMVRGETRYSKVSRFVKEIPKALLKGEMPKEKISESLQKAVISRQKDLFSPGLLAPFIRIRLPGLQAGTLRKPDPLIPALQLEKLWIIKKETG